MVLESLASGVKEQKTRDGWHEQFHYYLEKGQFAKARAHAENHGAERPMICFESHPFFMRLVREGRKKDYTRMMRAFEGYSFECWLVDIGSKPQIYKSSRRQ